MNCGIIFKCLLYDAMRIDKNVLFSIIVPVYNLEKAKETGNKYDVFLSGASAIEKITNSKSNTGKKLIKTQLKILL